MIHGVASNFVRFPVNAFNYIGVILRHDAEHEKSSEGIFFGENIKKSGGSIGRWTVVESEGDEFFVF